MSFANRLRHYRNYIQLTQDELADKIGVSQKTISSWETGRSEPTIKELTRLSILFDCTLAALTDTRERTVGEVSLEDIYAKIPSLDFFQIQELKNYIDAEIQKQAKMEEMLCEKAKLEAQLKETENELKRLREINSRFNHSKGSD